METDAAMTKSSWLESSARLEKFRLRAAMRDTSQDTATGNASSATKLTKAKKWDVTPEVVATTGPSGRRRQQKDMAMTQKVASTTVPAAATYMLSATTTLPQAKTSCSISRRLATETMARTMGVIMSMVAEQRCRQLQTGRHNSLMFGG